MLCPAALLQADAISGSGDTITIDPNSPPSILWAGHTGQGTINISGPVAGQFPEWNFSKIFLGANQSGFPASATAIGTLNLTGASTVNVNIFSAGFAGTGEVSIAAGSTLRTNIASFSEQDTAMLVDSGTFQIFSAGGANITRGASVLVKNDGLFLGSISLTGGADATFNHAGLGDPDHPELTNVHIGSSTTEAGYLGILNGSVATVGNVVVGTTNFDLSPSAILEVGSSTFVANSVTIGEAVGETAGFGQIQVHGADSLMDVHGLLDVGSHSIAKLELTDHGQALADTLKVGGLDAGATQRTLQLRGESKITALLGMEVRGGVVDLGGLSTLTSDGDARIGTQINGAGNVLIDGSRFKTNGKLIIGDHGTGQVFISDTQQILAAGEYGLKATGEIIIGLGEHGRGQLSILDHGHATADVITIGASDGVQGGSGWLNVGPGSTLENTRATVTGYGDLGDPENPSKVTIHGAGAHWELADLDIGATVSDGAATVTISQGALLDTIHATVGSQSHSIVIDAATWDNSSSIEVGGFNHTAGGSIYVVNGATVTTQNLTIGRGDADGLSNGYLDIESGAIVTVSDLMVLGAASDMPLALGGFGEVRNIGGALNTNNGATIGFTKEGQTQIRKNTVTIGAGGNWQADGFLTIGAGEAGEGSVNVLTGGNVVSSADTILGEGLEGRLTIDGGRFESQGILYAGQNGTGLITIKNNGHLITYGTVMGVEAGSHGIATISGTPQSGTIEEWEEKEALVIGAHGEGSITISDYGVMTVAGTTDLGTSADGVGKLNLNSGATFSTQDTVTIGHTGHGIALIDSGADLVLENVPGLEFNEGLIGLLPGSLGEVTVSGQGSLSGSSVIHSSTLLVVNSSLSIGLQGQGVLLINDHALVENYHSFAGRSVSGDGHITLTNFGHWINHGDLVLAESGAANMLVLSGSRVDADSARIGRESTGNGIATIAGKEIADGDPVPIRSTLAVAKAMIVGEGGHGTLNITNFGLVSDESGILGSGSGGVGAAFVKFGGEWRHSGDITLGAEGKGTLEITDGGIVAGNGARVGRNAGSLGILKIGGISNAIHSTFDYGSGFLNFGEDGTAQLTLDTDGILIGQSAGLGYNATGVGNATIAGGLWTTLGTLTIAESGHGQIIQTGGQIDAHDIYFARQSGSVASVTLGIVDSPIVTPSKLNADGLLVIGSAGTANLLINDDSTVKGVDIILGEIASGNGTATIKAGEFTAIQSLTIGKFGHGEIKLEGGVLTSRDAVMGEKTGSRGDLTISGTDAHWDLAGSLIVGDRGDARISLTTETARLTQTDPAITFQIARQAGSLGEVALSAGAQLTTDATVELLEGAGKFKVSSQATATVGVLRIGKISSNINIATNNNAFTIRNAGSILNATNITLGGGGVNALSIIEGAEANAGGMSIGLINGSVFLSPTMRNSVLVDGTNSRLSLTGGITIGRETNGLLQITNGGRVTSGLTFIGLTDAGFGKVTVAGGGRWDTGNIKIGSTKNVSTEMKIEAGGNVTAGQIRVGGGSAADGYRAILSIDGGGDTSVATSLIAASVFIGGDPAIGGSGAGEVYVARNGLLKTSSGIFVEQNGILVGNGGAIVSDVINRGGHIFTDQGRPVSQELFNAALNFQPLTDLSGAKGGDKSGKSGSSISLMAAPPAPFIDGNFIQESGELHIGVNGTGDGLFGQLIVSGSASILGGSVIFDFLDGYLPQQGDQFNFLLSGLGVTIAPEVNLSFTGAGPGFLFQVNPTGEGGLQFLALNNAIPEPSLLAMLGVGLLMLPCRRRGI